MRTAYDLGRQDDLTEAVVAIDRLANRHHTRLVDRGWRIYRYTKHDVYGEPDRIVGELTRALDSR